MLILSFKQWNKLSGAVQGEPRPPARGRACPGQQGIAFTPPARFELSSPCWLQPLTWQPKGHCQERLCKCLRGAWAVAVPMPLALWAEQVRLWGTGRGTPSWQGAAPCIHSCRGSLQSSSLVGDCLRDGGVPRKVVVAGHKVIWAKCRQVNGRCISAIL